MICTRFLDDIPNDNFKIFALYGFYSSGSVHYPFMREGTLRTGYAVGFLAQQYCRTEEQYN